MSATARYKPSSTTTSRRTSTKAVSSACRSSSSPKFLAGTRGWAAARPALEPHPDRQLVRIQLAGRAAIGSFGGDFELAQADEPVADVERGASRHGDPRPGHDRPGDAGLRSTGERAVESGSVIDRNRADIIHRKADAGSDVRSPSRGREVVITARHRARRNHGSLEFGGRDGCVRRIEQVAAKSQDEVAAHVRAESVADPAAQDHPGTDVLQFPRYGAVGVAANNSAACEVLVLDIGAGRL